MKPDKQQQQEDEQDHQNLLGRISYWVEFKNQADELTLVAAKPLYDKYMGESEEKANRGTIYDR